MKLKSKLLITASSLLLAAGAVAPTVYFLNNNNNQIFKKENENYMWLKDSVEKGKPIPDKTEKAFLSSEKYYNTYTQDYAYSYADHTQDQFQYWIKDNLQKLGLKQ